MRRAPAKPVRACTLRKWCPVSHVTFEAPLRPSHFSLHSSHSTLHTSHSTLLTSHCTLPNPHFTLHCTLPTAHSTLHTSHCTLHAPHCTLHTPHFISSELFSPYPSSSLLICHLSFHESLPSTTTKELACAVCQPGPCVLCAKLLQCCCPRTWPARDPGTMQTLSSHFTLYSSHPTLHTSHLNFISTHLIWALLNLFHVFPYVS